MHAHSLIWRTKILIPLTTCIITGCTISKLIDLISIIGRIGCIKDCGARSSLEALLKWK
jgi:hypothetical protein